MTKLIHYAEYKVNENTDNKYECIEYGDILENANNSLDTFDLLDYLQDRYRILFIKGFHYDENNEIETFAIYKNSFILLYRIIEFNTLEDNEIEIINYIKNCIDKDKNETNTIVFEFIY